MKEAAYRLPGHGWLPEPELSFHPDREDDRHFHPLRGLARFGPYSRSLINQVLDPIRVAAIHPSGWGRHHDGILNELGYRINPSERGAYLPAYPGFSSIFGLRLVKAGSGLEIELDEALDERIATSESPHATLADSLARSVRTLAGRRTEFDVLFIYLPEKWSGAFFGREAEDFDLHDYLKAVTADREVPMQILTDWNNGALVYPNRASVMWRLSIATYTKAGGIPWRLADMDPQTAFIGLSYAVQFDDHDSPKFVTCCSQVFDADGAGLEFIAYETDDVTVQRRNPFLNQTEMRRVMSRSLELYQRRHAGRVPNRIVVHKTSQFKDAEVEGCFDAFEGVETVDLLQVVDRVVWRGVKLEPGPGSGPKGRPAAYPLERGSFLPMSDREVLLWTSGNAQLALGRNYYKEGKAIPRPLLLRRFAGHGGWEEDSRYVLALTKMDWNNDALYNRKPVTLSYARRLAQIAKRIPYLAPRPYQFRYFM